MSINEIEVQATEVAPEDTDVYVNNNHVDVCADTELVITGAKREYAIVGDVYFPTTTYVETPAWMIDLMNDIIDAALLAPLGQISTLTASVLEALREVEVAKNQYVELINIEETIDSVIASRLVTINASLDTANAQIIDLQILKVTEEQAIAIAINQISSELYSPSGVLFGAITNIQTTISSLDGKVENNYLDLVDLNDSTAFVLTLEINRVEASIEGVAEAVIESLDLAYASDVDAVAMSVDTLRVQIQGSYASIEEAMTAYVSADEAVTELVTTLRADMDGQFASVELDLGAVVTDLGNIGSRYGVRLVTSATNPSGATSYIVGGFELLNDGTDVSAGFDVDEFWVGRVGITGKRPFVVSGGVVYLDTVVVQDGSITNAKIGNIIQSNVYVSGTSGWLINKDGNAYFNNIYARGDIQASSLTSNLVVTDAIRSSNFNVASPATSPGWGIYEDGRAYFANPVISRPNVILSGDISLSSVGSYTAAHYTRTEIGTTAWVSQAGSKGAIVDVHPDDNTLYLRDLEFTTDIPEVDFPNAATWTVNGPLLGVACVVTALDYFYSGSDPAAPRLQVGCRGFVERVGDLTSASFLRVTVVVPLPEALHANIRGFQIRNISWSILAVS